MPEWFMPSRRDLGPSERPRAMTVMMTELSDTSGGRVVVETRRLLRREWETAIYATNALNSTLRRATP